MAYIPEAHRKYNLLPSCSENGGEVFSYPSSLETQIGDLLPEGESVIPYGYDSYEEYYYILDNYISQHGTSDGKLNKLGELISEFREQVEKMNVKENWSICKYVGETTDNITGFTHDRYYYWPCSIENPEYEGVIDNEEFTSYVASISSATEKNELHIMDSKTDEFDRPSLWEIAEDPTGMAKRKLAGA
jgi:hypothetical protein